MKETVVSIISNLFDANDVQEEEVIQSLWSGYGKISRYTLKGSTIKSVIVKNIVLPAQSNHPRGWNTDRSHSRKVKSYQVEEEWYNKWAKHCTLDARIPECFMSINNGDEQLIILEDLDQAGFPLRKSSLNIKEVQVCLKWLANFHATFLNEEPTNLWKQGTYWHLATRPDEFSAMKEGKLKSMASKIDQALAACQFKTIVHGDAKVANFCFSEDMEKTVALDFQYVGGGCGMKDVIYLLGSCLNNVDLECFEKENLNYYFNELQAALIRNNKVIQFELLEKEWRLMYPIAWADFSRFLLGWMPNHPKINSYSSKMVDSSIIILEKTY